MRIGIHQLRLTCVLLVGVALPASAQAPESSARFERSHRAGTLVISFAERANLLLDADRGLSLRIYGDGRVDVHRPAYLVSAGDFTLTLTSDELDALVAAWVSRGFVGLDAPALQARLRAAEPPLRAVLDDVVSEFELHLERYRPAGGPEQRDVHKRIAWAKLRADARQHPADAELQGLAAIHRELLALLARPDLVRVTAP